MSSSRSTRFRACLGVVGLGTVTLGFGVLGIGDALDLTLADAVELGIGLLGVGVGLLLLGDALWGEEDGE